MRLINFIQILTFGFSLQLASQVELYDWKYAGPGTNPEQVKGLFKSVWADTANLNFMLAGSSSGGLFKTENALSEVPAWTNISDSYNDINYGVADIVVKPQTGNKTIYIATGHNSGLPKGYGNGILKTTDGGKSWSPVGPKAKTEHLFQMEGLVGNPENFSEMIAYTSKEIYFTRDEWQTYFTVEPPIDKDNKDISFCDVEFAPHEPGKFYCTTRINNSNQAKIFVSENFGATVKDITPTGLKAARIEVATLENEKYKSKFYIAYGSKEVNVKYFNGLVFSNDLNKMPVAHAFSNAYWCLEFLVNQRDTNILYLATTESSRSIDGGKTFEKIGSYNAHNTHADNRGMLLAKSSDKGKKDVLVLANDGGISYADRFEPVDWKNLNGSGLDAGQFWGVDVLQSDTLMFAGGAQDNGGFLVNSYKNVNNVLSCGDGYLGCVVNKNSAIVECNGQGMLYHNIETGKIIGMYVNEECESRRPMLKIDSFLYMGYKNIWRINTNAIERGTTSFEKFISLPDVKGDNNAIKNKTIRAMYMDKDGSAVVAFAHPNWSDKENSGKVFITTNVFSKQPEWYDLTALLKDGAFEICRWSEVYSVEYDLFNPFGFYMIIRDEFDQTNCRIYHVEYLKELNECKLKKLDFGLPKIGFNQLKINENSNILYLATDNGVYYSQASPDTLVWKKLNGDKNLLPSVAVSGLAFNNTTNTLFASTYGRGVWQTQLPSFHAIRINIAKNFTQNNLLKIDGELVVAKKRILTLNGKLLITSGSKISLQKNSVLVIKDKKLVRNERNEIVPLENYLVRHKTAKVVFEK